MVDIKHSSWAERDADNNSPSPNGIQNGYAPSTVGPILQATKAAVKRSYNQINAIYTTTGTATALVLTFTVAPAPLVKGERLAFFASQTNTGAMTLNINGLGAKSILQQDGSALAAGQIVAGSATTVIYDGIAFRLENYVSNPKFTGTVSADAVTVSGAITASALTGNGASITALNASQITSGTIDDGRLPATMTGKNFNTLVTAGNGLNVTGALAVAGSVSTSVFSSDTATVGGSRVLTMADFGAGKGLDADKLDGQEGAYYLNRANQNGNVPQENVAGLQSALNTKLPLTGGTITGGLVVNGGATSRAALTMENGTSGAASPVVRLTATGIRAWYLQAHSNGRFRIVDETGNAEVFSIGPSGDIATPQLGDLNTRIETRAQAYAADYGMRTYDIGGWGPGGGYSFAHGLGAVPRFMSLLLVCHTAVAGYGVGTVARAYGADKSNNDGSNVVFGGYMYADGGVINVYVGNNFVIRNMSNGAQYNPTSANFHLRAVYAR